MPGSLRPALRRHTSQMGMISPITYVLRLEITISPDKPLLETTQTSNKGAIRSETLEESKHVCAAKQSCC